jgi:hypothetical protein
MNKNNCDLDVMCGLYNQPIDGQWAPRVIAYHITPTANVESIRRHGLKAKECQAYTSSTDSRSKAVYLLASETDANDPNVRAFLFDATDLTVLTVSIPSAAFEHLRYDGTFNISCICSDGAYPSGIKFTADIPAGWIK